MSTRYDRQTILPGFGPEAQARLRKARVLVVGAGGLGCPALQYLAAAGVGNIGIVDDDTIALSNLHRQPLYTTADVGKPKALVARERLLALNPEIQANAQLERLTPENAVRLISEYDLVVDGSDNFATRYLVNDTCVRLKKTLVYGAVFQYEGQLTVLNYPHSVGPNYRCLYPNQPSAGSVLTCEQGGVLGVLPGIIGTLQALEIIKLITGLGEPLSGKLLVFDGLTLNSRILNYEADVANPLFGPFESWPQFDYTESCTTEVNEINIEAFEALRDSAEPFTLLDVREPFERDAFHIGGVHIPLGQLEQAVSLLEPSQKLVVYCKSGLRSATAVTLLTQKFGFSHVYNLAGGIEAYMRSGHRSLAQVE